MTKKKRSNGTFLFGVIVVGLCVVGYGAGPGGWFDPEEVAAIEGVPVRRGALRISEIARGNLEAKNSARMVNELEGRTTILFLAEEGTYVEKGQLVCELDVSDLQDRLVTQEISVKKAEAPTFGKTLLKLRRSGSGISSCQKRRIPSESTTSRSL